MTGPITLTDAEREALTDVFEAWWARADVNIPSDADLTGVVAHAVEAIVTARLAEVEAERDGWKVTAQRLRAQVTRALALANELEEAHYKNRRGPTTTLSESSRAIRAAIAGDS